jgi:hypothetical protein
MPWSPKWTVEERRAYNRMRYAARRKKGVCSRCPLPSRFHLCAFCREERNSARRPWDRGWWKRHKAKALARAKRLRTFRIAKGLCITCGRESKRYTRCLACREKFAERMKGYRAA